MAWSSIKALGQISKPECKTPEEKSSTILFIILQNFLLGGEGGVDISVRQHFGPRHWDLYGVFCFGLLVVCFSDIVTHTH